MLRLAEFCGNHDADFQRQAIVASIADVQAGEVAGSVEEVLAAARFILGIVRVTTAQ